MSPEPREFVDARPNRLFFKHIVRKIFLEDWGLKLTALVITFALWLGVTGLSTPTTQRLSGVPLSLRYSNDIDITNTPVQEVDLVVTGDKRKVAQINKNDLLVSVDIADDRPGERLLQLSPENVAVSLPTGVRLDEVLPRSIPIRVESVSEIDMDVQAETTGKVPEGYEVYSQSVTPAKVRIRGPVSFVRSLNFLTTGPIDLTGHTTDFTARQVPIVIANARATVLETVVDVAFRIGEKRVERRFRIPVRDDKANAAVVVLFGPRSLFDGVIAEDFKIEISRNEAGEEAPRLILPARLQDRVEVRQVRLQ
jgi:hypothetical protein